MSLAISTQSINMFHAKEWISKETWKRSELKNLEMKVASTNPCLAMA